MLYLLRMLRLTYYPKKKFDLEVCSDEKTEGLSGRGRISEKEGTRRRNSISKLKGSKCNKFCKYCRKLGLSIVRCHN